MLLYHVSTVRVLSGSGLMISSVIVYKNIAHRNLLQECDMLYLGGLYLWEKLAHWLTELTASLLAVH